MMWTYTVGAHTGRPPRMSTSLMGKGTETQLEVIHKTDEKRDVTTTWRIY